MCQNRSNVACTLCINPPVNSQTLQFLPMQPAPPQFRYTLLQTSHGMSVKIEVLTLQQLKAFNKSNTDWFMQREGKNQLFLPISICLSSCNCSPKAHREGVLAVKPQPKDLTHSLCIATLRQQHLQYHLSRGNIAKLCGK